jgi:hypothetical protein
MQISVFHQTSSNLVTPVASISIPNDITNVDDALDYAYRWTQNIHGSWSKKLGGDENENVVVINAPKLGEMGFRSTMIGDTLIVNPEIADDKMTVHRVGPVGMHQVQGDVIPD